jgi:hypothetical protein
LVVAGIKKIQVSVGVTGRASIYVEGVVTEGKTGTAHVAASAGVSVSGFKTVSSSFTLALPGVASLTASGKKGITEAPVLAASATLGCAGYKAILGGLFIGADCGVDAEGNKGAFGLVEILARAKVSKEPVIPIIDADLLAAILEINVSGGEITAALLNQILTTNILLVTPTANATNALAGNTTQILIVKDMEDVL